MKAGKLRGIIGNALILLFAVCTLGFMALQMFSLVGKNIITGETVSQSLGSVFDFMGKISDATDAKLQASLAFFIIVAILACALMITSIIGLVAVFTNNKKLNMTLVNRILTGVMAGIALIAMILAVACTETTEVISTAVNAGAIMPLVLSLFTVAGAITAPSKKKA